MEKINRLGKRVHLLAVMTIASVGMMTPAIATTDSTSSPGSWRLAQASPSPSPMSSPTTSPSPTRRPAATPTPMRRPAAAPTPTNSPTPTPTPSPTSNPAATTNQNLCRRVVKPTQGLVIRREPSIQAPLVGRVAYQGRVTLTTNPPTTKTADERDWVEISAPAKGWVSHSLRTETTSNLAYCQ
ncbi:MAG TPA: hypothetical protein V6D11_32625 [Waterburya sp.]